MVKVACFLSVVDKYQYTPTTPTEKNKSVMEITNRTDNAAYIDINILGNVYVLKVDEFLGMCEVFRSLKAGV